jgi:hypothetical protein
MTPARRMGLIQAGTSAFPVAAPMNARLPETQRQLAGSTSRVRRRSVKLEAATMAK